MTKKRLDIEHRFAKALDFEVIESGKTNYRTTVLRLRRLERLYLSQLTGDSTSALEIRRRIAEQMFEQALLHNCSQSVFRAKLSSMSKLGFSNMERKAHFYLLGGRAFLLQGNVRVARSLASSITRELESSARRPRNPLRKELLRLANVLLQEAERKAANSRPNANRRV